MRVAVFSTKAYDRSFLAAANRGRHDLVFFEPRLSPETSALARGFPAVCTFVNDELTAPILETLVEGGTRFVALRCRKIHRAHNRVREGNFALDGLLGFELHGRTVGIVGLGAIGITLARILTGFGTRLLGSDPAPHPDFARLGGRILALEELLAAADVVTLHCPLLPSTHHLIDRDAIRRMKPGAMLVNTGRGALIDTAAVIEGLKSRRLGALALDVYEEEADLFFEDLSNEVLRDDVFARLLTFPNVLITGHQGFFTEEALGEIARTTIDNLTALEEGAPCPNLVSADRIRG
ncbi:MAG: 2-hydroxyacid dehydrogenase [Thermodesulfobacteriota bacterium]